MSQNFRHPRNKISNSEPRTTKQVQPKVLLIGLSGDHSPQTLKQFFLTTYSSILKVKIRSRNKRNNKVDGMGTLFLSSKEEKD